MVYYRVREEMDGTRRKKELKRGGRFTVKAFVYDGEWYGGSLYTAKELQRMGHDGYIIDPNVFEEVTIKKTQIYFFFGLRFECST